LEQVAATQVAAELAAMRKWIISEPICGSFSIATVIKDADTTLQTFVDCATEEIRAELTDISDHLNAHAESEGMNVASHVFAAGAMLTKLDAVRQKYVTVTEALGEDLGVPAAMLELVTEKAKAAQAKAAASVFLKTAIQARKQALLDLKEKYAGIAKNRPELL